MREYLIFLDTEASGLPKKWNLPYSDFRNWPSAVQISWLVYTRDGVMVKAENHYIREDDIQIHPSAIKIHGITPDYLKQHGVERKAVLKKLADDLLNYDPLVVGHFMEFDYHIVSADFCRASIENPIETLPIFCTMLSSSVYSRDPANHLRLGELYTALFDKKLENAHNAYTDATATAECFFELLKRNDISPEKIGLKQSDFRNKKQSSGFPWIISVILILSLMVLISFLT